MTLHEFVETINMDIPFNQAINKQINPEIKTTLMFVAEQTTSGKEKILLKSYDWDKDVISDYYK